MGWTGGARRLGQSSRSFKRLKSQNELLMCVFLIAQNLYLTVRAPGGALCHTWDAGMHLICGPRMECSAPRAHLRYSVLWANLCAISMGPASLNLPLCAHMCFGSGHYWEISAHLCGCLRNEQRGREACFYLECSIGLKRKGDCV